MTAPETQPGTTASATAAGFAALALALALLILRCLPLRTALATAAAIGGLGIRPASGSASLGAIASCQRAARWYPGRAACLEI